MEAYQPVHDQQPVDRVLHRGRKGGTSTAGAIWSIVCTTVGAGVAGLPFALSYAGWIALPMLVLIAIFSNTTSKLIARCMHMVPGKRLKTYEDIGFECFGYAGRLAVMIFQCMTLFGVCTIFLILIGGNMNVLVPSVTSHVWVFIFIAPLLPIAWLKTMKEVSFLAFFGLFASLIVAFVVIIKGFTAGEEHNGQTYSSVNWGGLSNGFNIICFSFGVHAVIPAIEHEMEHPHRFSFVSNVAFTTITSIYLLVAAAGYYGYGNACCKHGNVLDEMDPNNGAVKTAFAFITAHVTLAYPLPLNPLCLNVEAAFGIDKLAPSKELVYRIILRTCLVFATVFVASVVPYFGDFLSLISALSVVATAFVFPPLFYYVLHMRAFILHLQNGYYHQYDDEIAGHHVDDQAPTPRITTGGALAGPPPPPLDTTLTGDVSNPLSPPWVVYLVLLIQVGVVGSLVGVYFAIQSLISDFQSGQNPFDDYFTP